jgi:hypothetical protein
MAPLQVRAAVSAVSTATVWVFNFLLAEITPVGFSSIGSNYYIIFACINACIVPAVYFFFPETKGCSLEDIDEIFIRSKSIWDPPKVARQMALERGVQVGQPDCESSGDNNGSNDDEYVKQELKA